LNIDWRSLGRETFLIGDLGLGLSIFVFDRAPN
jgi:hypothetical protein